MHIAPDLQLPSLPEVTLRALDACHQDESYRKISEIVSADTALVARILALANSALYGPSTPIRSVDQALLRLGTRRFHTLVLTAALRPFVNQQRTISRSMEIFIVQTKSCKTARVFCLGVQQDLAPWLGL